MNGVSTYGPEEPCVSTVNSNLANEPVVCIISNLNCDDDIIVVFLTESGSILNSIPCGYAPLDGATFQGTTIDESGRKMGKTYGGSNYVWKSDRTMGKTYQGDPKYKWESGASRGKANPLT